MEYNEDDFLMISGIQHFAFCRRQWALIHIEMMWEENLRTVEGNILHEKSHDSYSAESRGNIIISRGMPIFSRTLGVSGECDVVEFIKSSDGISLQERQGLYKVRPVEYKHGEPKVGNEDILQLVAQAICLEEMLLCKISSGALFYGKIKRRENIDITEELKEQVRASFMEMHDYYNKGYIPKVKPNKSCRACSLKNLCLPQLQKVKTVENYYKECFSQEGIEL